MGVLIKKISLWTITENSFGFSPMENNLKILFTAINSIFSLSVNISLLTQAHTLLIICVR